MDRRERSPALAARNDDSKVQKPQTAAERTAALKARVAAAIGSSKAKGGLNIGLHPALEGLGSGSWKSSGNGNNDAGSSRTHDARPQPSVARTGSPATTGASPQHNPYFDESAAAQPGSGKGRQSRQLVFNQHGKYIQQANAMRSQAALEAMKKRVEAQTRKVGINEDVDVEKNFAVEAPPDMEWWDDGLFDGTSYDAIDDASKLKITTEDSIISPYIQHPVALEPPQEGLAPPPKAMYLTTKEQKKIRRQRRAAEMKEWQTKVRLGLLPAPPPKVKAGNMMRVLGEAAVKDPTAVEAQVNRQIAERHEKHVNTNEERKLTKDQKHEKLAENQEKDAAKGIRLLAFKINSLANGQHRYKIGMNAQQLALTGMCIMHPKMNLVVVEGGEWSVNKFRKLMLNRIDWTQNAPSRDKDNKDLNNREWLLAEDDKGALKDMSFNECKLVFEGEEKGRVFRKWASRVCETDSDARDILARTKMDSFWNLAKAS